MRILLALILSLYYTCSLSQPVSAGKPRVFSPEEEFRDSANRHCLRHDKYDKIARLSNYPFSQANSVRIISFKRSKTDLASMILNRSVTGMPNLVESVLLGRRDIDTLTDIIYNVGYQGEFYSIYKGCYEPRNAILFLDAKGKVFAYIELCFTCFDYRLSSGKIVPGEFCLDKYDLLSSFFSSRGVEYGTLYKE